MNNKFHSAVVHSVEDEGLRLLFPGSDEPSQKCYPCNTALSFQPGQRVFLIPTEGSYVVAFPL